LVVFPDTENNTARGVTCLLLPATDFGFAQHVLVGHFGIAELTACAACRIVLLMSKRANRRPQTPKVGNRELAVAMQEKRRSSATDRHRSVKDYQRKPKHPGKGYES
jgi:hypothetical protein